MPNVLITLSRYDLGAGGQIKLHDELGHRSRIRLHNVLGREQFVSRRSLWRTGKDELSRVVVSGLVD